MTHAAEPTGDRVPPSFACARDLFSAAPASGPARGVGSGQFSGHDIRRGASIASGADRESGDVAAQLGVTAGRDRHSLDNTGAAAWKDTRRGLAKTGCGQRVSQHERVSACNGPAGNAPASALQLSTARPAVPHCNSTGQGTPCNLRPSTEDATAAQPAWTGAAVSASCMHRAATGTAKSSAAQPRDGGAHTNRRDHP